MLTARGRRTRGAATVIALLLIAYGTVWGTDDHFPFGPFKMYARATKTTGVVATPFLVAVDAEGAELRIRSDVFGLRPAELEGQYPRLKDHPDLLGDLAIVYKATHPGVDIVEVRLMRRRRHLVDSVVVDETTDEVAAWQELP